MDRASIRETCQRLIAKHEDNLLLINTRGIQGCRQAEDAFKQLTLSQKKAQVAYRTIQHLDKGNDDLIAEMDSEVYALTRDLLVDLVCNNTCMVRNAASLLEQESLCDMVQLYTDMIETLKRESKEG